MKRYLFKYKKSFIVNVLFMLICSIISIASALILKDVVDSAVNKDMKQFKMYVYIIIGITFLEFLIGYIKRIFNAKFMKKIMLALKNDIFLSVMNKNIKEFLEENSAQYISILNNDVGIVENDYFVNIMNIFGSIISFILASIAIINLNIYIACLIFALSILLIIVPQFFNGKLSLFKKKYSDSIGHFTTKIKDIFSGFEIIKSFNIEKKINSEYVKYNSEVEETKYKFRIISNKVNILCSILSTGIFLGAIIIGGYFSILGSISVGTMIAAIQLMNSITSPLNSIIFGINRLKSVKLVEQKLIKTLQYNSSGESSIYKDQFNGKIDFNDVEFCYNEDRKVINGVSFKIEKGSKIAIVGASGSGKSTILKLLLRYYDNFKGEILIDGEDIRNINHENLYKLISIIHQNIFMFDGSLKDNISLYNDFKKENIHEAISKAGLDVFINSLPKGLNTLIGENGNNLSGGEKQRIAIARALVRNTSILVLDEITSSLDNITSYKIERDILDIEELTAIIVTHKFTKELLERYDTILVMKEGEIVEEGTFHELLENRGYFHSLYYVVKESD